jgi:hypothetical protein
MNIRKFFSRRGGSAVGSFMGNEPRKDARTLAMRDPALAAALGIIGDDFGAESRFGGYGSFGGPGYHGSFGGYGSFGDDPSAAAAAASAPVPVRPGSAAMVHPANHPDNQGAVQAMWNDNARRDAATRKRLSGLYPNADSNVDVERYSFPVATTLTALGTPQAFSMSGSPDCTIRPQRVLFNSPAPAFAMITDIKVANLSALIGGGTTEDTFFYSSLGQQLEIDVPTINPQNKVIVPGSYTGFVPTGFTPGLTFPLVASFRGPALVTGQLPPTNM